jgi:hypothetical protein
VVRPSFSVSSAGDRKPLNTFPLFCKKLSSFLDSSSGGKVPGPSLLSIGVEEAISKAGFDEKAFLERGGIFDRTKPSTLDW